MRRNWRHTLKRTGLKRQSEKRKRQNAEYLALREDFLTRYPKCHECGRAANQIHHAAGRQGLFLLMVRYWIPLCGDCHRAATDSRENHPHLFVRVRGTAKEHIGLLEQNGVDITIPMFAQGT